MRVILAAGGSGGHIFPSVSVALELKKMEVEDIYFVSSKRRLDKNILINTKYPCFFLSVNPMPRSLNPFRIIAFLAKLALDAAMSFYIILKVRPDAVVGFGGYSAGAITCISKLFRIPVIIHEQNFFPGRANVLLSRLADKIAVSFKGTGKYFPKNDKKVFFSGNPLRIDSLANDRIGSLKELGLSLDKLTVLVMGGSQGSSFLNRTFSQAARYINEKKGEAVQFIHLTGKKDYDEVKNFYDQEKIPGRVFSFMDRIADAYASSDLVISRSGAAAVFELAYYGKPMILIPYPNPKNNQRSNAIYFSEAGAAIHKEENDILPKELAEEIMGILADEKRRRSLSEAAKNLSVPNAARQLAEEVVKLASRNTN